MDREQLVRGCEKIIDLFAEEEDVTERIMIPAVRHAIGAQAWITMSDDERMEEMRNLFRAFKAAFNVRLIDDRMTREDLQRVQAIREHIKTILKWSPSDEVFEAASSIHYHVTQILAEYKLVETPDYTPPQRNTSISEE
jgi:N-glycosylase/DNA lyase